MPFNRNLAVEYARKYAMSPNPDYPAFHSDCASFVSQAMLAGGWTMIGGGNATDYRSDAVWWWGKGQPITVPLIGATLKEAPIASHTWGGAANFSRFIRISRRGTAAGDLSELQIGDVIQIAKGPTEPFHSMIVTRRDAGTGKLYVSYHSTNRLDYPLDSVQTLLPTSQNRYLYWKIL